MTSFDRLAKIAFWTTVIVITFVVMFQVAPLLFPESQWAYALRYNTDSSNVEIVPKPTDCDWDYAPLGRKDCHYEKVVSVTKYSTDTKTGRSIVTHDDGKTWDWVPEGEKAGPAQVYVTWSKMPH